MNERRSESGFGQKAILIGGALGYEKDSHKRLKGIVSITLTCTPKATVTQFTETDVLQLDFFFWLRILALCKVGPVPELFYKHLTLYSDRARNQNTASTLAGVFHPDGRTCVDQAGLFRFYVILKTDESLLASVLAILFCLCYTKPCGECVAAPFTDSSTSPFSGARPSVHFG